jgi:TPP-dependent pyruvate/acetoin dehydrogenase alpha subunit
MEHSLISAEKLRQMYAAILKLRLTSEHPQRRKGLGRKPQLHFHEACEVGCTIDLRAQDSLFPLPTQFLQPIRTNGSRFVEDSDKGPRSPSEHTDWPGTFNTNHFGQRVPLATGAACLHRMQRKDNLVVAFVEADEIGNSRESLRLAHDHCLPIIFVLLESSSRNASRRSRGRDPNQITVIPVDQVDVVAVYRVCFEAMDKARRGAGPTVIHCVRTAHVSAHKTPAHADSRDPLLHMELYLRKKALWSDDFKRSIGEDFSREANHISGTTRTKRITAADRTSESTQR